LALYVGTSGWAYREWKPGFYPLELPQRRFLQHYSQALTACEINSTFYRLQSDETIARWASSVPKSFRYSVKAHRRLTHVGRIVFEGEQRSFLDGFLKSVSRLGTRLGVVLFQFPPGRAHDPEALDGLLQSLPAGPGYAFEFRHPSWHSEEVRTRIADAGGTLCVAETSGGAPRALPPGPFAYVRLRAERYSEAERAGWGELLMAEAETRDVYAFAKHEAEATDDPYAGVGLARWLVRQRGARVSESD
jgi:uncharacterized protein YecE (DUF72 family)